jgi:hypothetical protein
VVEERLSDGHRIAQLLASEVDGDEGRLPGVAVVDADRDVEPTPDGAFAFAVADVAGAGDDADGEPIRLAAVYVHPDRVRVEVLVGPAAAADAGREAGLRVRPKAVDPPRTLLFVEDGAAVKRVAPVLAAAREAAD